MKRAELARELLGEMVLGDPSDQAQIERIAKASAREILDSTCASRACAEVLLDAADDAWNEYLEYVACERPTSFIGHEPKEARRALSREAWRVYDAARRSNTAALHGETIIELLEHTFDEEAERCAEVVRKLVEAARRSRENGLQKHFAENRSPLC